MINDEYTHTTPTTTITANSIAVRSDLELDLILVSLSASGSSKGAAIGGTIGVVINNAKALVNNILDGNSNQTNITMNEALEAAEYAYGLRTCTIEEYRVPGEGLKRSHHFANMATWEVNWGRVREEFADYLQSSFLVADDEDEDDDF